MLTFVKSMLISFINARNGLHLFEYLKKLGCVIEEEAHTVLPDSSEYGLYTCKKDNDIKAVLAMHYIDHHYAALMELRDDASDREVLEALIKAKQKGIWIAPVEPVIYMSKDYEIVKKLSMNYSDEIPPESTKYLEKYFKIQTKWKNFIEDIIISLIKFAENIRNANDFIEI